MVARRLPELRDKHRLVRNGAEKRVSTVAKVAENEKPIPVLTWFSISGEAGGV